MKLIQLILIAAIGLLTTAYVLYYRSKTLNRVLFAFLFLLVIVFVLVPDLTNSIAHFLGVGRGADLLLYCMVVFFYAAFIFLYSRLRKIEIMITELIRSRTIKEATKPTNR